MKIFHTLLYLRFIFQKVAFLSFFLQKDLSKISFWIEMNIAQFYVSRMDKLHSIFNIVETCNLNWAIL